jgi:hypothetical protein
MDLNILMPVIMATMGLVMLIRNKTFASRVNQRERQLGGGKELEPGKGEANRILVVVFGLSLLGLGVYLTIKAILMSY